jgi:subtilisin family serine protease
MILKVLNSSNYGYFSWWADGIYYATDNGARVINLSMGGPEYSLTLETATAYAYSKGVVVVASMGNNKTSIPAYPAAFPGIIAVGSTDPDDARTQAFLGNPNYGSSFGQHISVVAPGNYVPGLNFQSDTDYSMLWGGTSMAAPHVAGLASLLVALKPSYRPSQIRSIIESTAEDLVGSPVEDTPGWDQYYGYGRINAYRALSQALGITEPAYSQGQFSVYPNPACGDFTVSFPPGTKQIVLLDPSGRIISTTQVTGERTHLFRGVKAGFYLIRLTGEQAPCTLVLIAS